MNTSNPRRIYSYTLVGLTGLLISGQLLLAQSKVGRILSGVFVTQKDDLVEGVSLTITSPSWQGQTESGRNGVFHIEIPSEPVTLKIEGRYIASRETQIGISTPTENLKFVVEFQIPPIHESLVITASFLTPASTVAMALFTKAPCSPKMIRFSIRWTLASAWVSTKAAANRWKRADLASTWTTVASMAG